MRSLGTSLRPRVVLMTMGKNDSRNAIAYLDEAPVPSQMIRIGATATFGVEFTPTSVVMTIWRSSGEYTITTERPTPMMTARKNPTNASWSVYRLLLMISDW